MPGLKEATNNLRYFKKSEIEILKYNLRVIVAWLHDCMIEA
jgi:hypothetical protein